MILIVGSGGNGQTYFMKELKKSFLINRVDDLDYIKHMATPLNKRNKKYNYLIKNNKITKCIFLYNDPFDSICSHFRRKWQWQQLLKLGNSNRLNKNHVRSIHTFFNLVDKIGKDLYSIEYQFNNWYKEAYEQKYINFPVYFLNFSKIDKKELSIFLNCKEDNINIKINKKRSDKYKDIRNTWPNVDEIYKKLYEKINNKSLEHNKKIMNSLKIKNKTNHGNSISNINYKKTVISI